jgi:rsbT co-antagonist protein RsbR
MPNILEAIQTNQEALLEEWLRGIKSGIRRRDLIDDRELKAQAAEMLTVICDVPADTPLNNISSAPWQPLKDLLASLSAKDAEQLFEGFSTIDDFLDKLALHTTDAYIHGRDQVIQRQQEEMLELSTPVVTLWEGIVALPLIGTLDSARTQVVMESLLQAIVQTNSRFAIIDITGVPTVDTLVAQHLLKTITAARLMGAECILSGIRPQIAQTIVHLGINLEDIITKARLADAFRLALERSGRAVTRIAKPTGLAAPTSREP